MSNATPLFGLDWGAMIFSLVALYLIGRRNRLGFLSFIAANVCWVSIGWLTMSPAIMFGNIIFDLQARNRVQVASNFEVGATIKKSNKHTSN